ncbi:unnamed protein product, partial [Iphiclides podalirius]
MPHSVDKVEYGGKYVLRSLSIPLRRVARGRPRTDGTQSAAQAAVRDGRLVSRTGGMSVQNFTCSGSPNEHPLGCRAF